MRRFFSGVMVCALACGACTTQGYKRCNSLEGSTQVLTEYLVQISIELEKYNNPEESLHNIQKYTQNSQKEIDVCVDFINHAIENMTHEEVLKHHEAYISDPRVKHFLDTQDKFHEKATPEQIETLDGLLTPFLLLSE